MENLPRWSKPGKTELLSLLPSFSPSFSLQIFAGNYTPAKLISIYDFVVWNPPAMDRASRSVLLRFYNNWKNCVSRPTSRPLFPAYITSDIGCFPFFFFFFSFVAYRVIDPLPLSGVITFVKNKNIKRYFKRDIIYRF